MTPPVVAYADDYRLTVESLRFYVPAFHQGEKAERILVESGDTLPPQERNRLEVQARLKTLAVAKIESMCKPLIVREINKLINGSHLRGNDYLFNILYETGVKVGMIKGLRHFDVNKIQAGATNYLFQWIVTYARKELATHEATFGIAPSRFQKLKKVSAVRKKITEQLGRYATNQEVLDYFHSGKADIKTMAGRLNAPNKGYASNKAITMDLVQEQEKFEKTMAYVQLLDPLEDYQRQLDQAVHPPKPFNETIFGAFNDTHPMTDQVVAVLMSELGNYTDMTPQVRHELDAMTKKEYRATLKRITEMATDPHGPFQAFIRANAATLDAGRDYMVGEENNSTTDKVRARYTAALFPHGLETRTGEHQ